MGAGLARFHFSMACALSIRVPDRYSGRMLSLSPGRFSPEAVGTRKRGNLMSTMEIPQAISPPADDGWIPSPLYRLTVEQYEAMVASGVFSTKERFHLIKGYLVAKMTQNPPHWVADELCGAELARIVPANRYLVAGGKPVRLPGQASEPEPDRCVVRGTIRDYERRHPGPEDVALIVEVADSSLASSVGWRPRSTGPQEYQFIGL